jgi:hypothetical protein
MKLTYLIPFLLFLVVLPTAFAQSTTYIIPLLGFHWDSYTIGVEIPSNVSWAHDQVVNSLKIWNQAQLWFAETYFPSSQVYTFVESSSGPVIVGFIENHDAYEAQCSKYGNSSVGCAGQAWVYFDMSYFANGSEWWFQHTSTHEFGHVLGLGHSLVNGDLMCADWTYCPDTPAVLTPSTLDLYAVHMLAAGMAVPKKGVTLPSYIPFQIFSQGTVPEYPATSIVLVAALLCTYLVLRVEKRRRNLDFFSH